jgi:hypothetical protein
MKNNTDFNHQTKIFLLTIEWKSFTAYQVNTLQKAKKAEPIRKKTKIWKRQTLNSYRIQCKSQHTRK